MGKFNKSAWGQKLARSAKRANLSDFERFQVMVLKKKRNTTIKREVASLKRKSK